jgi:peptidyl-prolyl cis-trans isomerase D
MVMQQMRENTKWIMLVTALAFVGLMIFEWGMDLTGQTGTQLSGGEVGRVNGEAITYEEFQAAYRTLYDQQAASGVPINSLVVDQLENAAWDQLVMQRLIAQELRRRGIQVTESEIRQAARYAPPPEFQNHELFRNEEGQFDITRYHEFLSSPAVDTDLLLQLEAYYRDAIPRSKLYYQSTAGVYVTDNELWRMWRDANDKVTARFMVFDPATLVPEAGISVSDAEIRSYYDEHRSDFLRPAQARVRYTVMDRSPTPADSAAAAEKARAVHGELAGGATFETVLARETDDSAAAADGGQTRIVKGQIYPAIEQAAFTRRPGTLSEPILTPAGYTVLRVDSVKADTAIARQVIIPVELSQDREDELFDRADSLEVLAETMNLQQIGEQLGLQVRESELLPGLAFVPGIGMADEGANWAFKDAEVGEVSPVFETPNAYYAFELTQREEERTLTLAEATATIRTALIAEKKLQRAKEMVRQAVDRIERGDSWETVAGANRTEVQQAGPFARGEFVPGLGRLNAAIGTAFGLKPGQTSGVVEADGKLYVIHVLERQDASRAEWEAQKEEQRQRVTAALAEQRWNEFLVALRENAEVEDGRAELDRRLEQAAQTSTATF